MLTLREDKLFGNVWCGSCRKVVYINIKSARIEREDLIPCGACAECGGLVARLIEGEQPALRPRLAAPSRPLPERSFSSLLDGVFREFLRRGLSACWSKWKDRQAYRLKG